MIEKIIEMPVDEGLAFVEEAVEKTMYPDADAVSLVVEQSVDIISSLIEDIF